MRLSGIVRGLVSAALFCAVTPSLHAQALTGGTETSASSIAHIEIKGNYPEGAQLPGLFGDLHEGLTDAIARLDKAADDAKVAAVVLQINDPEIGWAKVTAFRQAIARVQAKGKKVHACLDDGSNMHYLLATACDEIVMPEPGTLSVMGVRAEVMFFRKLFDMVGIKADMLRVGEFKSAAEQYTRTEMSPEFRKEMEELLDDYYKQLVSQIAKARKLPEEKVAAAIDAGPLTARQARELGLIDRVAYQDEVEDGLQKPAEGKTLSIVRKYGKKKIDTDFSGFTGMMKMMELLMGVEPTRRKSSSPKLAIIYASGMIMTGKSQSDFFSGESTMGSETMVKAIRDARNDNTVKAIVLRVDSPGGSALASDLIWHELSLAKQPVVVSMGDVAGSGGYYISMGANRIFADPGTITGSIGVVGGKIALQGLFNKIGITTDVISRGKNSGAFASNSPFSESEREAVQKLLNEIYDQFVTKAAKGRKMEKDALEKLARGRIYSGTAAVKIGLVDELGTLDDAIAAAKKLAGLKPEDKLERLVLPKATSPFEQLFGSLDPNDAKMGESALYKTLRQISPDLAAGARTFQLLQILSRETAVTVMPFQLNVR
jgi:protease IV